MTRLIVFLTTVGVFTVLGGVVGYLFASSILQSGRGSYDEVEFTMSYIGASLGGLVVGVVIYCYGEWLFGPAKKK